jgi:DNA-binding NtrC family response regulator
VRELEACIKRCIALTDDSLLSEALLPASVRDAMSEYGGSGGRLPPRSAQANDRVTTAPPQVEELRALLQRHQGNVAAVGRELGKARMQIHRWMKKYGIDIDDFRA